MTMVHHIPRIVLGGIFLFSGLNSFFNIVPPPIFNEQGSAFMIALMSSKYFFPFLKGTELICGLLLIANQWVPTALLVLAPIIINIFLFHLFLEPSGLLIGLINIVLLGINMAQHQDRLLPLIRRR